MSSIILQLIRGSRLKLLTPCSVERLYSPAVTSCIRVLFSRSFSSAVQIKDSSSIDDQPLGEGVVQDDNLNLKVRGFYEKAETSYYHKVMENLKHYQETLFNEKDLLSVKCEVREDVCDVIGREDWRSASLEELLEAFRQVTSYACENDLPISMPQFHSLSSAIKVRLEEFSDSSFLEVGKLLANWPSSGITKQWDFDSFLQAFDKSCCTRYQKSWFLSRDMIKILKAADIFYWQKKEMRINYLRLMIFHCSQKTKNPHLFLQLMFYLGLLTSAPSTYKFYDLERKVYSCCKHYSLPELALVVHSFFRLKSRLQYYPLMQSLLTKSLENISDIDNYLLATICKGLVHAPKELLPSCAELQRRLLPKISDFNVISCVHALWMFGYNGILSEDFGTQVYEKALRELNSLRTKELTRLLIIFSEYESPNRNMKAFAEAVVTELRKPEKKLWLKRKNFIRGAALHRILACGICPFDLINDYLSSVDDDSSLEALGVDVHIEALHPDYTGARLRPDLREKIYKYRFEDKNGVFIRSCDQVGKRSTFNMFALQCADNAMLELVGGKEDCLLIKRLVPSFGYLDTIFHVSKDWDFLPIPNELKEGNPWELTRVPAVIGEDGSKLIALTIVSSGDEFAIRKISWLQRERNRILKMLGFLPLHVSLKEWSEFDITQIKSDLKLKVEKASMLS